MVRIPLEYLTEKISYERAVAENMYEGRAFGLANDDWGRLMAKMQPGDELWNFAPPSRSFIQLWGVALVRDGQVVSTVITAVD